MAKQSKQVYVLVCVFDAVVENVSVYSHKERAKDEWERILSDVIEDVSYDKYEDGDDEMIEQVTSTKYSGTDIFMVDVKEDDEKSIKELMRERERRKLQRELKNKFR